MEVLLLYCSVWSIVDCALIYTCSTVVLLVTLVSSLGSIALPFIAMMATRAQDLDRRTTALQGGAGGVTAQPQKLVLALAVADLRLEQERALAAFYPFPGATQIGP